MDLQEDRRLAPVRDTFLSLMISFAGCFLFLLKQNRGEVTERNAPSSLSHFFLPIPHFERDFSYKLNVLRRNLFNV